jgi:hypothetical protein
MSSDSPAVKLMIQSGLVPQNVVQQLVNWRLLPGDSVESTGSDPVTLEQGWESVEGFVAELNQVITEEMATIRQTDLNKSGHYEEAFLTFADSTMNRTQDVFVDQLGRLVLPAKPEYETLLSVSFRSVNGEGEDTRTVVSKEPRYEGTRRSALVVCLESKEAPNADH